VVAPLALAEQKPFETVLLTAILLITGSDMQTTVAQDEQVLKSLNNLEMRRFETDLAFRAITTSEVSAREKKTERLRAARMQAMASARRS
jgi:hypothetical protein